METRELKAGIGKASTGIEGLDEITGGGVPRGRVTLVAGNAGCGKTLLGMHFITHGATRCDEPGIILSFEESREELEQNIASLGVDLAGLEAGGKIHIERVKLHSDGSLQVGEFNLEPLFIRLDVARKAIGAKRVLIDSCDVLFASFADRGGLRLELQRLFAWLKERDLTAIVTAEAGDGQFTRHGLQEYVSDCVLHLDHRVYEQISTRRLRVVKYRGSAHGTNEYPFLIDAEGLSVLPITSLALQHVAPHDRISCGIERLDSMLEGGLYRGSTVLVSGTAGTGKTTLAMSLADAACRRGEKAVVLSFEESPDQLIRNMRSVGMDLQRHLDDGLMQIHATRSTLQGLEAHLTGIHRLIERVHPSLVIVDPITAFLGGDNARDVRAMLTRLIDYFKNKGITAVLTNVVSGSGPREGTETEISSLVDVWLIVRDMELNGERNRTLLILKARGIAHSNQVREFNISSKGIALNDVYIGLGTVLTGSSRIAQEASDADAELSRKDDLDRLHLAIATKERALEAQVEALKAGFADERAAIERNIRQLENLESLRNLYRHTLFDSRRGDADTASG